jgi:hypothetical protein
MRYVIALLIACSAFAQTTITWTQKTLATPRPDGNGWLGLRYDPVSTRVLHYGVPQGSVGIYSTTPWAWNVATDTWSYAAAARYDSTSNQCTIDKPDKPGDRHPYEHMAIDTRRNRMWLAGGVNQTCLPTTANTNGTSVTWTCCGGAQYHSSWVGETLTINGVDYTVASVESPTALTLTADAGTQTGVSLSVSTRNMFKQNTYYLSLNADPSTNQWTRTDAPAFPSRNSNAMVYVPGTDVLFMFGRDGASDTQQHHVFCPTDLNPTPGTLTAAQTAAGCATADAWTIVTPSNGTVTITGSTVTWQTGDQFPAVFPTKIAINGTWRTVASRDSATQLTLTAGPGNGTFSYYIAPPGNNQMSMHWDSATSRALVYGGHSAVISQYTNQTWAYSVEGKKWTQKCISPCSPPPAATTPNVAVAYMPSPARLLYRQTTGTGAPADWEYDPVADTWTQISSSGTGPTISIVYMAYAEASNTLVVYGNNTTTSQVFEGVVDTQGTSSGARLGGAGRISGAGRIQ